MDAEKLRDVLEYYQDLGFTSLYRRTSNVAVQGEPVMPKTPGSREIQPEPKPFGVPGVAPANDSLAKIREDIGDCKRCRLHQGRHTIVFGSGNEQAKLVFVGEGPRG